MNLILTHHARQRAQQRGVLPRVTEWLLDYGREDYDGRGGVIRSFDRHAIARLRRDFGDHAVVRHAEHLRCYLVESARDGAIVTVGKRHAGRRIRRR